MTEYCDDGCKDCMNDKRKDYEIFMIWDDKETRSNLRFVVISEDGKERYEAKHVEILTDSACKLHVVAGRERGSVYTRGELLNFNDKIVIK